MRSRYKHSCLLVLAGLALSGCSGRTMLDPDQTEPIDSGFVSMLHTADPRNARQLIDGFYYAEQFGRWTKPKFSIVLAVPHSPSLRDPALLVKLFIPDQEMKYLKSMSLSASVNGVALAQETFINSGPQAYVRSLPAGTLASDQARVDFTLDKWMPAGALDSRELGMFVKVAGLKNGASPEL